MKIEDHYPGDKPTHSQKIHLASLQIQLDMDAVFSEWHEIAILKSREK